MKRKGIIGIFTIIATLIVNEGIKVYNGTGEEIIVDGVEMKAIELKKNLIKEYNDRDLKEGDTIKVVIHCSVTPKDYNVNNMAIWHVDGHDWAGIGYHMLIRNTKEIYLGNHVEKITYHSSGENTVSIGICLIGDYDKYPLDEETIDVLKIVLDGICQYFTVTSITGHRDSPRTNKTCPGNYAYEQLTNEGIFFDATKQ
jgi:hypothetical protein